jgi:hypothetical protein
VPVLYQTIQQIELNNVTAVIQVIDEFYIVLPDPEIYSRGLRVSTIRVAVGWNICILQAVIAVAAKESALIGQSVSEELMKFLYYLGKQAIFKKYHSDLDPKLRDPSVTFSQFAKFFEHKVITEQEFQLTITYEGPSFPNNDLAMSIYNKLYGKHNSNDKNGSVPCISMQSANMATKDNWCHHPACRGKQRYANHLWDVCPNNRNSPHFRQQAANKDYVKSDSNKQFSQKPRTDKTSKTSTKNPKRSNEGGFK